MESFKLTLPDGGQICGRVFTPSKPNSTGNIPFIVCLPGGTYDASYFDVNEKYSISTVCKELNFPVVSLSRPGYSGSTQLPPVTADDTYGQQQGKYVNSTILPALWKEFGKPAGATAVVILAHSIGAMMATIAVGAHTRLEGYPLAGLITSGIGAELEPNFQKNAIAIATSGIEMARFPEAMKDASMLQLPFRDVTDPEMTTHTEALNKDMPVGELHDINVTWLEYWRKYSDNVKVPVKYGISEFDQLWISTEAALQKYRDAFPSSPRIESGVVQSAPHCIELSRQSAAWYTKCCGFAQECAAWYGEKSVTNGH